MAQATPSWFSLVIRSVPQSLRTMGLLLTLAKMNSVLLMRILEASLNGKVVEVGEELGVI